jgi:hypothetical protein
MFFMLAYAGFSAHLNPAAGGAQGAYLVRLLYGDFVWYNAIQPATTGSIAIVSQLKSVLG